MQDADEGNRGDDVMRGGDYGGEPEAPLEAHRQIDQRDDEAEEDRHQRLPLQFATHLRTDRLPPLDAVLPGPGALVERTGDGVSDRLRARLPLRRFRAQSRAHDIRGIRAEVLNIGALETDIIECRADIAGGHPVRQLDLHERPARELDAVVDAPRHEEAEADKHDRARERECPAAPFNEVVIRVREESDHQMLTVTMFGRRFSQMRNNVFTTKIAETIEARMPMISVMAKPCTGPVPTA